jgi:predicted DNA-binding transcriptional regulator AlpA
MAHNYPSFISRKELADAMGVSKYSIMRWTKLRGFPEPLPNSGRIPVYDIREVENWLRHCPQSNSVVNETGIDHD